MQFVYLGEAGYYGERINEFLSVSKNLEIREIAEGVELNDTNNIELNKQSANENDESDVLSASNQKVEKHELSKGKTIGKYTGNKIVDDIETKYQCQYCDKVSNSRRALLYHTKSKHEGLKYGCNKCGKQYTTQSDLSRHFQSVHEGVKYACNLCDYQATRQSSVTRHIESVHEGVKYACNQCDYQATAQSSVTRHIQSLHDGVKYACSQCDYQGSSDGFYRHMKTKHL